MFLTILTLTLGNENLINTKNGIRGTNLEKVKNIATENGQNRANGATNEMFSIKNEKIKNWSNKIVRTKPHPLPVNPTARFENEKDLQSQTTRIKLIIRLVCLLNLMGC